MPRATQQGQLPTEYTRETLDPLKRPQIQALAKREGIKANITSDKIITALIELYQQRVEAVALAHHSVQDVAEPTVTKEEEEPLPQEIVQTLMPVIANDQEDDVMRDITNNVEDAESSRLQEVCGEDAVKPCTVDGSSAPDADETHIQEAVQNAIEPAVADENNSREENEVVNPDRLSCDRLSPTTRLRWQPSISEEEEESRSPYDRRRHTPYPPRRPSSDSRSLSSRCGEASIPKSVQAVINPTDKDVRDVRRRLTALNDSRVSLEMRVKDMKRHLSFSSQCLARGARVLEESRWRRQAIEYGIVVPMKGERHLWDGTGNMESGSRKKWEEFVAKHWVPGPPFENDGSTESSSTSIDFVEESLVIDDEDEDDMYC